MNNTKKILWGVVFILLGIIIFLNRMGYANIDIFFNGWWTLFIIVPSLFGLFDKNGRFISLLLFIIGVLLLLSSQNIIDYDVVSKSFLPIVLIIIGLKIIFKGVQPNVKIPTYDNDKEYYATFSKQMINNIDTFNGCDTNAVFGSLVLDLRDAKIKNDSVIKASSIFGGTEIFVNDDVNVIVKSTSIFGKTDNDVKNINSNKTTIYIETLCLFGGVEIKNGRK